MGKSSAQKMNVVDYRMSIHLGICNKIDRIRRIHINEKLAWEGNASAAGALTINKPDLYGGEQKEGGVIGYAHFLPGNDDQVLPENLAAKLGKTSATCPGFRGVASIFFHGFAAAQGFLWAKNSPIIAQNVWFDVERTPLGLDPTTAWFDDYSGSGAHIIYEALTNTEWGMGSPAGMVGIDSFDAAAIKLKAEGLGMAIYWNKQSTIEAFVGEVLNHIQATLFLNPATGKLDLKLIRDDYVVADLDVFDATNCKLRNFQQKLWGETTNEVVVSWTNPENEETQTVTMQDLANASIQGQIVSTSRNYYGFVNVEAANLACARDLRAASAPLCSFVIDADRSAWNKVPGDVIVVNWPEHQLYGIVARVLDVEYGKPGDGAIKMTCVQDIFSLDHPEINIPTSSEWIDPSELPTALDAVQGYSLPYYFASSTDLQTSVVDLEYPETLALLLGYEPDADTYGYDLLSRTILPNGDLDYVEAGRKTLVDRALLGADLTISSVLLPASQNFHADRGPRIGGFIFLGATDETGEIIQITDVNGSGDWMLKRGVLDTVPRGWAAGTPMWFVNLGGKLVDDATVRSGGEIAHYKMLPWTSRGRLPEVSAPIVDVPLIARPHLPLRPANVKINGVASGAVNVAATANIAMTWATRNREFEDGQILNWTDPAVAGEYAQHTVIQVFDTSNAKIYEYVGLYTETGLSWPKSYFARWATVYIRVISRRGDLDSLQGYTLTVNGLANNPAAALPPTPPPLGPPPSPTIAPDPDDFELVAGPLEVEGGAKVPCITLKGVPTETTATRLLLRYRPNVMPIDWRYHGIVSITTFGQAVQVDITAVIPLTDYVADIAYGADGAYDSDYVTLGVVNSGAMVASDTTHIGGHLVDDVLADLDTTGEELLKEVLTRQLLEAKIQALVYDGDGKSIKLVILEAIDKSDNALAKLFLMGAVNAEGNAFVLDATKVMVDGTTSLAQYITQTSTSIGENTTVVSILQESVDGINGKLQLSVSAPGGEGAIVIRAGEEGSVIAFSADEFYMFANASPTVRKKVFGFDGELITLGADVRIDGALMIENSLSIGAVPINFAVSPAYAKTATSYHGNGSTTYTLCETTITLTTAGYIECSANVYQGFPTGNDQWDCWLYLDGAADEPTSYVQGAWTQVQVRMDTVKYKPAGTYVVQLKWKGGSSVENVVGVLFVKGFEKTS